MRRSAPQPRRHLLSRRGRGRLDPENTLIVFVIGIVRAILGSATKEVEDGQSLQVRVASYGAPASVWYGAITMNPEQVFED